MQENPRADLHEAAGISTRSTAPLLVKLENPGGPGAARVSTQQARREAVERVIRTMRNRYGEPLSLNAMARVAFSSPFHFSRVFRQVTGVSPVNYLAAVRLEMAKRLLLTTQFSVTSICFEVGYNSVGTFTSLFTQFVGVSPRQLRRMKEDTLVELMRSLPELPRSGKASVPGSAVAQVRAPSGFEGPIFIGLFPEPIPRGRPTACAVMQGPGSTALPPVPRGRYHLFAAGLTRPEIPVESLVCSNALRGSIGPVEAGEGGLVRDAVIELRPPEPIDPPLVLALPCLFAEWRN